MSSGKLRARFALLAFLTVLGMAFSALSPVSAVATTDRTIPASLTSFKVTSPKTLHPRDELTIEYTVEGPTPSTVSFSFIDSWGFTHSVRGYAGVASTRITQDTSTWGKYWEPGEVRLESVYVSTTWGGLTYNADGTIDSSYPSQVEGPIAADFDFGAAGFEVEPLEPHPYERTPRISG